MTIYSTVINAPINEKAMTLNWEHLSSEVTVTRGAGCKLMGLATRAAWEVTVVAPQGP